MSTALKVQNYLKCLGARDLENIVECFGDEVDWNIPGDTQRAPWLGKRSTKAQIKEYYQLLWENTIPLDARIDLPITEGDNAVVTGEFSSKMTKTGKVIDSPFSIQLRFESGLICYYRLMEDSYQVSQSLV